MYSCFKSIKGDFMKLLMSIGIIVVTSLVVFASSLLYQKKGESSIQQYIDDNNLTATTVQTQDYRILDSYNEQGELTPQLLDINKTITTYDEAEGIKGNMVLQMFKTNQLRFDTLAWKINDEATTWTYQYEPELIITQKNGCCGALNGARAYNPKTGKLVMSYSPFIQELGYQDSPFLIDVPNTRIYRMIGVLSADSSRDFPPNLNKRDELGYSPIAIIKYADENNILQKFAVKVKTPEFFAPTISDVKWVINQASKNESRSGRVSLWEADGKEDFTLISDLALELKIYGESTEYKVKIPITKDRFDISSSELPEEIILMPLD